MRNFAVKFAMLASGLETPEARYLTSGFFLDKSPETALEIYKKYLPKEQEWTVSFGFSDRALLNILDQEFHVNMGRGMLVFRKTVLDAESIRLASGMDPGLRFAGTGEEFVRKLSGVLLEVTRHLYRQDMSDGRLEDIRNEYRTNLRIYAAKYSAMDHPADGNRLSAMFYDKKQLTGLTNAMTADAMFKVDAAEILFGQESAYTQAWRRKLVFRHMITQAVQQRLAQAAA